MNLKKYKILIAIVDGFIMMLVLIPSIAVAENQFKSLGLALIISVAIGLANWVFLNYLEIERGFFS